MVGQSSIDQNLQTGIGMRNTNSPFWLNGTPSEFLEAQKSL
jgi:hypothetical protein